MAIQITPFGIAQQSYSGQVAGTVVNIPSTKAVVLKSMLLINTTAAVAYLQMFNVPAAQVTLGTTAPTLSIGLPANAGLVLSIPLGYKFGDTAFSVAGTTTRTGSTGAAIDANFVYD